MAILFVAAEADELKPFAAYLTALRKLNWPLDYAYEGILEGRRLMLVANGAGPGLAARALEIAIRAISGADLSASKLEAVVCVGYCGALQPDLQPNAIVIPAEVLDSATQDVYPCSNLGISQEPSGVLISQNRVANTAAEKQELGKGGAIAVDMEAGGIAVRAKRAGLPFSCIKVVSDRADESFGLDLNAMRAENGRVARGKIVCYALTHPALIPELFRLRRRTQDAAKALGEFLVSCRIHFEGEPALAE
jgi:adenosylhomocysteine nucleosidase